MSGLMSEGFHGQCGRVLGGAMWLYLLLLPPLYSMNQSFLLGQCLWLTLLLNIFRRGRIIFRIVLLLCFCFWVFTRVVCMIGDLLCFMLICTCNSLIKNYLWTVVVHCEVGRAPRYSLPLGEVSFALLQKLYKWRGIISRGSEVNIFNTANLI